MAFLKTDSVKLLSESLIFQEGNKLELEFNLVNDGDEYYTSHESKKYKINGEIEFQVRVISVLVSKKLNVSNMPTFAPQEKTYMNTFYVRGLNVKKTRRHTTFKLTSFELQTKERLLDMSNDLTWRLIALGSQSHSWFKIEMVVTLEEISPTTSFASLYDDTILTDFELRGDDGSVSVHRAVLAASSPVLKTMLEGTWKETSDGGVKIPNTSRATLQFLKQYLYLNILPDEVGLENLLLLASCYMIDDLKEKCELLLVNTLTADNVLIRTQFAVQNAMTELHIMILERVQTGDIKVEDIRRKMKTVSLR